MANQVVQRLVHGNFEVAVARVDGQSESPPADVPGYWKYVLNPNANPPEPEHDDINRPPDEGFSQEDDPVLPDQEDGAWTFPLTVETISYKENPRNPESGVRELDPTMDLFAALTMLEDYKREYSKKCDECKRLENKVLRLEALKDAS